MTKAQVIAMLEANQDERGIRHWDAKFAAKSGLKSFGIGLTRLRKMAKQIGKDHDLAAQLWKSDVYDAKIIALLIDDPKQITREQAERQVDEVNAGHLGHVFSTCGAPLAKTPFAKDLADEWMDSSDVARRGCGFGLLYELAKSKKKSAPDDAYFIERIEHIERTISGVKPSLQLAMGHAVMGIGVRNKQLHPVALAAARKFGKIDFDPNGKCDPFDVEKNLMSDYVRKKFGI